MEFSIKNYVETRRMVEQREKHDNPDHWFGEVQAWTETYFVNMIREIINVADNELECLNLGSYLGSSTIARLSMLCEIFGCGSVLELKDCVKNLKSCGCCTYWNWDRRLSGTSLCGYHDKFRDADETCEHQDFVIRSD